METKTTTIKKAEGKKVPSPKSASKKTALLPIEVHEHSYNVNKYLLEYFGRRNRPSTAF